MDKVDLKRLAREKGIDSDTVSHKAVSEFFNGQSGCWWQNQSLVELNEYLLEAARKNNANK